MKRHHCDESSAIDLVASNDGLTRRDFLIGGLGVTAIAALGPAGAHTRPRARGERILVVVQLSGGNDGLNTVLPIGQDEWYRARPNLSRVATDAHDVADGLAFHPSLGGFARMLREGTLTCVHSVGYPDPDRSHFHSMDIWHSGDLSGRGGAARGTGWLARLAEQLASSGSAQPVALYVGDGALPRSLIGDAGPAPSIADMEQVRLRGGVESARTLDRLYADDAGGELGFLRRTAREALDLGRRLEGAALGEPAADWPQDRFAKQLELVSRLIRSGLGTRIYKVELDGFDTHRDQPVQHAALLQRLDGALSAFRRELAASGDDADVITLVFSEFGRRVRENASLGTDHGAAGPVFLLGPSTRGGFVGAAPDMARPVDGDVPHGIDFRAVHAALESHWLGARATATLAPVDVLAAGVRAAVR